MTGLLTAFFISLICTFLLIRLKGFNKDYFMDSDLSGPQKFHSIKVPRIGGISIALGFFSAIFFKFISAPNDFIGFYLMISAIPVFFAGLYEDITKNFQIRMRLIWTIVGAILLITLTGYQIDKIGLPYIDAILGVPYLGAIFTIFAITGLTNSYNIIDGFNGLASMVGILTCLGIAYISFIVSDPTLMYLSFSIAAATLGFFVWNYPRGLIFMGDGGAYVLGFTIAALSILLTQRHGEISPWFALLLNGYPIVETIFTIHRRTIHRGKNAGHADGIHLHSLIYRRILSPQYKDAEIRFKANAKTSVIIWIMSGSCILAAILSWKSPQFLILFIVSFAFFYLWIYKKIVRFQIPSWLRIANDSTHFNDN